MATWTYIRGWVELTEEMLPVIQETIRCSSESASRLNIETADHYNDGWILPEEPKCWAFYAFYGRDVRIQSVPFIRHQMELIAQISTRDEDGFVNQPHGLLLIDEEEEDNGPSRFWVIRDGTLSEALSPFPPFSMP